MSIAQRIAEYKPPRLGGKCTVCAVVEQVSKEDAAALKVAFDNPKMSNAGIALILKEEGFKIGESTVRRHRRGECQGD